MRLSSSLKVDVEIDGDECNLTVVGVPVDMDNQASGGPYQASNDKADAEDESEQAPGVCAVFANKINLLDLIADVQDIYRSFATNIALTGAALQVA